MSPRVSKLLFAIVACGSCISLPVLTRLELKAACPNNKPSISVCLAQSSYNPCQNKIPCTGTGTYPKDGAFSCADNGSNRTQCLDGTTQDMVPCWFEISCIEDDLGECYEDLFGAIFVQHNRVKKVISDCDPIIPTGP